MRQSIKSRGTVWTEDEVRLALLLYFQIPFGQMNHKNRQVVDLAARIGRSPSSVAMKLGNLASLDANITGSGRVGLKNASALDRKVWDWYHHDWSTAVDTAQGLLDQVSPPLDVEVTEALAHVMARRGQQFFRNAVLTNFDFQCCVTGMNIASLLNASHIVPWRVDVRQRLNPANGLCLNAMLDRAFDRGLVGFDRTGALLVSRYIARQANPATQRYFYALAGQRILPAQKMSIDTSLLDWHRHEIFEQHLSD